MINKIKRTSVMEQEKRQAQKKEIISLWGKTGSGDESGDLFSVVRS